MMPITFHFSNHIIWITLSGQYSIEEGCQTYSAILSDFAFNEGMNLLFDERQSAVNPTLAEIKERVALFRSQRYGRSLIENLLLIYGCIAYHLNTNGSSIILVGSHSTYL
jgi:hypothetical protein